MKSLCGRSFSRPIQNRCSRGFFTNNNSNCCLESFIRGRKGLNLSEIVLEHFLHRVSGFLSEKKRFGDKIYVLDGHFYLVLEAHSFSHFTQKVFFFSASWSSVPGHMETFGFPTRCFSYVRFQTSQPFF